MSLGLSILIALLLALVLVARWRREPPGPIAKRAVEQFAKLVPRMVCALIGAGFLAELLPKESIATFLGPQAGYWALLIAAVTGLIVPAGPVISFPIAVVFAKSGASTAALVTFITSWSLFTLHRVLIYELPLLGPSFLRMRVLSVVIMPFGTGLLAVLIGAFTAFGTAIPIQ